MLEPYLASVAEDGAAVALSSVSRLASVINRSQRPALFAEMHCSHPKPWLLNDPATLNLLMARVATRAGLSQANL